MSMTGTRSYTGTATLTPTMTVLSGVAAAPSSQESPSVAIVGIAAGASVVGVLGVAFAVAYSRRSPKQKLVNPVYHDEAVEVRHNPVRAPLERQRSMTYPVEPEAPKNVMPQGLKNHLLHLWKTFNLPPQQVVPVNLPAFFQVY